MFLIKYIFLEHEFVSSFKLFAVSIVYSNFWLNISLGPSKKGILPNEFGPKRLQMAIHKLSNNVREVYPRLSFEYMDVTSAYSSPFSIECYGLLRHHFLCHMVHLISSYQEQQRLFCSTTCQKLMWSEGFLQNKLYGIFFNLLRMLIPRQATSVPTIFLSSSRVRLKKTVSVSPL